MNTEQHMAAPGQRVYSQAPWLTRIKFWLLAQILQKGLDLQLRMRKLPESQSPSFTKLYPSIGANLPVRVFVPPAYEVGGKLPPLWIDIHGGGFTLCNPSIDDIDNSILSRKHGFCVVSIPYRKAPDYRFPTPTYDCAALIRAVLDDEDNIPADRTKVVVGGYSAGANLSLSAAQLDGLHDRINAIVAYYPILDSDMTLEEKLQVSKIAPGREKDTLADLGPLFNWAYIPHGQNRRDPLLSPAYAPRSKLPKNICLVGCEYDLLCGEARNMAECLANSEEGEKVEDDLGWSKGNIRWICLQETEHGFNTTPTKDPELIKRNTATAEQMHQATAEWLYDHVFACA